MTCTRCPATGFSSAGQLFAHLVEHHSMKKDRAEKVAAREWDEAHPSNGNGYAPSASAPSGHVCECGRTLACDYEGIARLEHQAMVLRVIASKWKARKAGTLGKSRRANVEWTDEEARALVAGGMSLSAVGKMFGASHSTIGRAVANGAAK